VAGPWFVVVLLSLTVVEVVIDIAPQHNGRRCADSARAVSERIESWDGFPNQL
jgi:hypothetical protein